MAATGKTPILLYGSTTVTNVPSAGNLTNSSDGCEIAINVADKNLFFKDSSNVVNTVPIRQSGTSSNGWLSSTDWNTFNNKQPSGTYVTSVTGTAPVVSSGGTTPAISMAAANGSTNGYLTSTDWTTFNSKQVAYTNLTTIGSLANATGWLYNNGSGTFSYSIPNTPSITIVTSSSVSPTATYGNEVILCNTTSNSITVNLPTAVSNNATYTIKKIAAANSMIIDPNGTQTIDGSTTITITVENTSLVLVSDGSNWRII